MKKLFTIDDFIIALPAAVGYGFGWEIPRALGYSEWACLAICLVVGMIIETLEYKIVFSKIVQRKPAIRFTVLTVLMLIFSVFCYVATEWLGIHIVDHVLEQYMYIVVPPVAFFVFRVALRRYRILKIRKQYGDGSSGFLLDKQLEKIDIDEFNKQNQPIHGAFDKNLAVKTKTGTFVGEKYDDAFFFVGIPYAKPPVGERRWKAPEPLPESDEVFEAINFGASAVQIDYEGSLLKHHRQSEDCLTLNICIRKKKTKRKKPVLVIFHHGDFSYGSSADPLLYGGNFEKIYPDSVGVTFNYRLGIFGFIDFSEVPGGENYPDALNLGLLDQIAALRWIKENISAFGGDPEKITVMGFESGAVSISLLAVCEQARGLFQKAFIFYGNPLASHDTPESSRNLAKKLLQETSTKTMEELMRLPTERLKEVSQKLMLDLSSPTRDDKLFPVNVYDTYKKGIASDIEFLVVIPKNERQIYRSYVGDKKYESFISKEISHVLNYFDANDPAEAKIARDYLKERSAVTTELEAKGELYEQLAALSSYNFAKELADGGSKVHFLHWNVKPLIENLGSGTVDVVATLLGNREAMQMYGSVLNQDLAETLQNLFRKFQNGEKLQLFNNEIKGISAIDWKEFPKALIVSEKSFTVSTYVPPHTECDSNAN